jgi:hypothetical protein
MIRRARHLRPRGGFLGDGHHAGKFRVRDVVEFFQELDGLEVFAAAELVGNPLALLARVVEVKHRGDGVHAQAVHMKAFAPEQRVGDEKIGNLVPAKIKNQRAPVLMRALARVLVLEERGAVEFRERPFVARKMRGHPVHDDADAGRVQRVDEKLKILRRAEAAGRREKAGDLIAPRRIKRVLGHRQKFDVREAHALEIKHERSGEFAVAPRFVRGFFAPRADVDLVNAHRRTQRVAFAAFFEPRVVGPLEFFRVPDDRGLLGRHLEEKPERIGVQLDFAVRVADLKFVMRADADAGQENFPDARRAEQPHRMKTSVPAVKIADDADALRVRRPDREARAGHAVNGAQLRAELVINFPLVALAKEKQVRLAERRQK